MDVFAYNIPLSYLSNVIYFIRCISFYISLLLFVVSFPFYVSFTYIGLYVIHEIINDAKVFGKMSGSITLCCQVINFFFVRKGIIWTTTFAANTFFRTNLKSKKGQKPNASKNSFATSPSSCMIYYFLLVFVYIRMGIKEVFDDDLLNLFAVFAVEHSYIWKRSKNWLVDTGSFLLLRYFAKKKEFFSHLFG